MFTEMFAFLSALTGLEVVPIQNLFCGLVGSGVSPVVIYTGKRVYDACKPTPKPVSVTCSRILDQLSQTGWRIDSAGDLVNGIIDVNPKGLHVKVDNHQVLKYLSRRERRMVFTSARSVCDVLKAEAEANRKAQVLAALAPDEDDEMDEEGTDLEPLEGEIYDTTSRHQGHPASGCTTTPPAGTRSKPERDPHPTPNPVRSNGPIPGIPYPFDGAKGPSPTPSVGYPFHNKGGQPTLMKR